MKIVTASNGKRTLKMSRKDWEAIGKKAGWMDTVENIWTAPARIMEKGMNWAGKLSDPLVDKILGPWVNRSLDQNAQKTLDYQFGRYYQRRIVQRLEKIADAVQVIVGKNDPNSENAINSIKSGLDKLNQLVQNSQIDNKMIDSMMSSCEDLKGKDSSGRFTNEIGVIERSLKELADLIKEWAGNVKSVTDQRDRSKVRL